MVAPEVQQFHEQGYIDPFPVLDSGEIREFGRHVDRDLLDGDSCPVPYNDVPRYNRHVDSQQVFDICTRDDIVERMRQLYGDDLMLWASKFWDKKPGAPEVPWHQHYHHTLVDPPITLTAWIALTPSDTDNGALQVIPGTHDRVIPEVPSPEGKAFERMADLAEFNDDEAVTLEMEPGECLIFNERTLHRSFDNSSERRRLALSARVTVPFANYDSKVFGVEEDDEFSTAMMISGTNDFAKNTTIEPPHHRSTAQELIGSD